MGTKVSSVLKKKGYDVLTVAPATRPSLRSSRCSHKIGSESRR